MINLKKDTVIILDRDGVINYESPDFIKTPEEWHPIPGSLEGIALLKQAHYKVVVATNQSGIGRGYFNQETLNAIHGKIQQQLEQFNVSLDGFFFCPHLTTDNCDCRKPKPGLIYQIEAEFNFSASENLIPFVGDTLRDLQAATAGNCQPILVKTGNGEKTLSQLAENNLNKIPVFENLLAFAESVTSEDVTNN